MRRVLETIFRHPVQMVILLLVPTVIGTAVALIQPRVYEASANIWAVQRYSIIGATGPEADMSATPASTQATALTELLQTRSFSLAVAGEADLKSTMSAATRSNAATLNDALFSEISKNVKVIPVSANLYQITYDSQYPAMAKRVVAAVVDNFGTVANTFSTVEGRQLLSIYNDQLTQAKATQATALQNAADYLRQHRTATTSNDPTYAQLYNQQVAAQSAVLTLENKITTLTQNIATMGTGSSQLYLVVDAPSVGDRPISRVKTVAVDAGLGLAVALLICTIYLVLLLRQDRAIYSPSDLRRSTSLPVVLELPYLNGASRMRALNASGASTNGVVRR